MTAQEPETAPGQAAQPLPGGIALAALECIRQEYETGTMAHDTAHKALDDYFAARRAQERLTPGGYDIPSLLERVSDLSSALHEIKTVHTPGTHAHDTARAALDQAAAPPPTAPAPELLSRLQAVLLDVRVAPVEARIQALGLLDGQPSQAVDTAQAQPAPELATAIDPDKLDLLADWFDVDDLAKGRSGRTDVQEDLRRWAGAIREARQLPPGLTAVEAVRVAVAEEWQPRVDDLRDDLDKATRAMLEEGSDRMTAFAVAIRHRNGLPS